MLYVKKIKFTKSDIYIIAGRDFSVKQFVYSLKGAVFARLPTGDTASFRFVINNLYIWEI